MARTLVIGYGNIDRNDDGVAYAVIAALRSRLGLEPLAEDETGLDRLGAAVDPVFVLQLGPELLDLALAYDRLLFVDAHVHPDSDDLHCAPVQPEYTSAAFTHHMNPAMFLALLQALYQHTPAGFVVSIRGHSFEFCRGLSEAASAQVTPAVEQILSLVTDPAACRCGEPAPAHVSNEPRYKF
jgi:hydrogenase maturation protease